MSKSNHTFAKKLKKWRDDLGVSQPRAATLLKVNVRSLRSWEQNINQPSPYALEAIKDRMSEVANMSEVET